MAIDNCLEAMAREWYGYGRWEAPYWFIGPEPGNPDGDNLKERCAAWNKLGRGELLDCKDHHIGFGWCNWHREIPSPPTQPTWRPLIQLLLFLLNGAAPTLEEIRSYQQHRWGMRSEQNAKENKTCVIELCSLAAKNLGAKKNVEFDPSCFVKERIEIIQRRIHEARPRLVLMYGLSQQEHWQAIADKHVLVSDEPVRIGTTWMVLTPHPVSHGRRNSDWLQLAERFRKHLQE